MGERRALVIGSQCHDLQRLTFLPRVAESLFDVLTDPERGGCVEPPRSQLVLDPELQEMVTAVNHMVAAADADQATMIIAFTGHAESVRDQLYLLPSNGTSPPTMDTGFLLGQRLAELIRRYSRIDGLVLLLDACQSGVGLADLMTRAGVEIAEAGARVQLLTATYDQAARDGCFSRTLHALLRDGLADVSHDLLHAETLAPRIANTCTNQEKPRYVALQGDWRVKDPGLWLARNVRATHRVGPFKRGTPEVDLAKNITSYFQPTEWLGELVGSSVRYRLAVVEGEAGCGKSALSAALADPYGAGVANIGCVPSSFVQALVFASLAPTPQSVAATLHEQLSQNVDGFTSASKAYRASLTDEQAAMKDRLELDVIGPLHQLHQQVPSDVARIGVILDGWYQLTAAVKDSLTPLLSVLSGPELTRVRLIVTTRPNSRPERVKLPRRALVRVGRASDEDVRRYFRRRSVKEELHDQLVELARGRWVHARLLADITTKEVLGRAPIPRTLEELYAAELRRVAAFVGADQLCPVLTVLTASPTGPVLPLPLLVDASRRLGGPDGLARVRDVLVPLEGLVVRARPGTEQEQVGLFHDDLRDYIREGWHATSSSAVIGREGHRALVEAIDNLVPAHPRCQDPILRNYADRYHVRHLWELEQYPDFVAVLQDRRMQRPADNRDVWQRCLTRLEPFGPDHPLALIATRELAASMGQTGAWREAVRLLSDLRARCERTGQHTEKVATGLELARWTGMLRGPRSALVVLGPHSHWLGVDRPTPESDSEHDAVPVDIRGRLQLWREVAHWTGELGRPADAVGMLGGQFASKMAEVFGPFHPDTLAARHELGRWTAEAGGVRRGLDELESLLADQRRFTPDDDVAILRARHGIAYWTGELGRPSEAVEQFKVLLEEYSYLGTLNFEILMLHHNLAHWIGQRGDVQKARRWLTVLLARQKRVLPRNHRDTLATRQRLAFYKGQSGSIREALDDLQDLTRHERATFPPSHVHPLRTRHQIANWTGELGRPRAAEKSLLRLLRDASPQLSFDHPDVFAMRGDQAHWVGEAGDARRARELLGGLKKDMLAAPFVGGENDPRLLTVEGRLAYWIGESGDPTKAVAILRALLPRAERILMENRRRFTIEHHLAHWIGQTGGRTEARERLEGLLEREVNVLGPNHPHTLFTTQRLAFYCGEDGDIRGALCRARELLEVQGRLLGAEHPSTLRTRRHIARWIGEAGDAAEARRLLKELLRDQSRLLGSRHPHTLRTRHDLAIYTMRDGDAKAARRDLKRLRRDEEAVLMEDHPATLRTVHQLAQSMAECGDIQGALEELRDLLEKQQAKLSLNHPDIARTEDAIDRWEGRQKGESREKVPVRQREKENQTSNPS